MRPLLPCLALAALALPSHAAKKPPPDHWVGTWATAPVALSTPADPLGPDGTTFREIVHTSLGGPLVRVVLTNEFGTEPLTIGAAHLALTPGKPGPVPEIALTTANALTFGGAPSVTIPPRGLAISDPAALKLQPFTDVVVSLFVPPQPLHQISGHSFADQTSFEAPGNVVNLASLPAAKPITTWPFLKGVDVLVSPDSAAIVAFGDSITDGALSTQNANRRWPDLLAERLHADPRTANLAILNEGIGGNRLLHEGYGPSALARFDRDVIAQAGVRYVVLMEGINDIGQATGPNPHDPVSAPDLIAALGQLAARAHTRGLKVFGATLTPFVGAGYQSAPGETMREAVNDWIRSTHDLDGVLEFDQATRDPAKPTAFLPAADSGDHLHPGDAGYKMMAGSVDLTLFTDKK